MNTSCLINGQNTDLLPVSDRGLQYGDGLFETIRVDNGKPLRWKRHMQRLTLGCEKLNLPLPDVYLLLDEAKLLCQEKDKAVLKIIYTRGSGSRGYSYDDNMKTTRILQCYDWPKKLVQNTGSGVELRISETRLSQNAQLAGIKHLNRLEQVLARSEWDSNQPEIYDAIMLDSDDYVIECTMHNIFYIKDECLVTPDLSLCGVSGIIRDLIIEYYNDAGMNVKVTSFSLPELLTADEVFITNSLGGVIPVGKINESQFTTWPQSETTQSDETTQCETISKFVQQSN